MKKGFQLNIRYPVIEIRLWLPATPDIHLSLFSRCLRSSHYTSYSQLQMFFSFPFESFPFIFNSVRFLAFTHLWTLFQTLLSLLWDKVWEIKVNETRENYSMKAIVSRTLLYLHVSPILTPSDIHQNCTTNTQFTILHKFCKLLFE